MNHVKDYLTIPTEYGRSLGGLRWADNFEAVEYSAHEPEVGLTFAMAGEISEFIEGFQASRSLIGFAYVLHLLQLLGSGDRGRVPNGRHSSRLKSAFRAAGRRRMRHAGIFFGTLCRDVPRASNAPDRDDLDAFLRHRENAWDDIFSTYAHRELPSLAPEEFEERVVKALDAVSDETLTHWLAHGQAPFDESVEVVEREAIAFRPKNFAEILAILEQRPRLANAVPLVPYLAGALSLPSRRRADQTPSVGGYSDVTTRGRPEQILPSQFALDDLEFVRRFASNELLYYHREQPRAAIDEELILVLDQGVRTWGDVRLILSAVAMSYCRQSDREGTDLRLATTATSGRPTEIARIDSETLGTLLEASNLTLEPSELLRQVLEGPAERPRDVILLTHPRNLKSDEVIAAARSISPGTRLFAVAVDAEGAVELLELRGGVPISLGRCRVSLGKALPKVRSATVSTSPHGWQGDVEPIGFPFRVGVLQPLAAELCAFDYDGDWVLAGSVPSCLLYAYAIDGSRSEILPRPMYKGRTPTMIEAIVGVARGFVVEGWVENTPIAAHYDFESRWCRVHELKSLQASVLSSSGSAVLAVDWLYLRHLHCVVARSRSSIQLAAAIDLEGNTAHSERPSTAGVKRAIKAVSEAREIPLDPLPIITPGVTLPATGPYLQLIPQTGKVIGRIGDKSGFHFTPLSDGKPSLQSGALLRARRSGSLLALLVEGTGRSRKLHFYDLRHENTQEFTFSTDTDNPHDFHNLRSFPFGSRESTFELSQDGRHFAHRSGAYNLEIRAVTGGLIPVVRTSRARFHDRLEVELGNDCLLIRIGKHAHLVRWRQGPLQVHRLPSTAVVVGLVPATAANLGSVYDPVRFVKSSRCENLTVLVDSMGHLALLDDSDGLVAMFFAFRHEIAAWLPDGTKLGPPSWIGGPSTPKAAERIAEQLRVASGFPEVATP